MKSSARLGLALYILRLSDNVYAARLADYVDFLDESVSLIGVEELPKSLNGANSQSALMDAYKDLFQRFGSHVAVIVNNRARFQLVRVMLATKHPSNYSPCRFPKPEPRTRRVRLPRALKALTLLGINGQHFEGRA